MLQCMGYLIYHQIFLRFSENIVIFLRELPEGAEGVRSTERSEARRGATAKPARPNLYQKQDTCYHK